VDLEAFDLAGEVTEATDDGGGDRFLAGSSGAFWLDVGAALGIEVGLIGMFSDKDALDTLALDG
jgi:hypothetical protein